jgi:hypothetical protein
LNEETLVFACYSCYWISWSFSCSHVDKIKMRMAVTHNFVWVCLYVLHIKRTHNQVHTY